MKIKNWGKFWLNASVALWLLAVVCIVFTFITGIDMLGTCFIFIMLTLISYEFARITTPFINLKKVKTPKI